MDNPKFLQLDFGFDTKPLAKPKPKPKPASKVKSDFVFDIMDMLTSPIIVFDSAWKDCVPKDVLNNITLSRMMCRIKGEEVASITEVVAYMMPRTFEAPMQTEWVNIYTWCGLQYAKSFKGKEQVKDMEVISPVELSDYEHRLLKDLRTWIYDKRRKALKQSLKSIKMVESANTQTKQKELFDN